MSGVIIGFVSEKIMKDNIFISEYFIYQGCLNIEQGVNLWHLLNQVLLLNIPGDVVELGSLTGMTAAVIQRTLDDFGSDKKLYLFDSYEGLPPIGKEDSDCPLNPENFKTSVEHTIQRFNDLRLQQPRIIPGWFCDTLPHSLPEQISFAHVDGDLYQSTIEALTAIYPRLPQGAIVLVDDYADPMACQRMAAAYNVNPYCKNLMRTYNPTDWLPGVKLACDEFLADKPEEMTVLIAGEERHAFFRKT
jgi:O-methyltransferase